jgi:flagellar assembly factor FliW
MTSVPTLESSTEPVLRFETGLPGFPDAREFVLVRLDDAGTVFSLRSAEDAGLRFLAVPPGSFFPAYSPELPDDAVAELGLRDASEALVLLLVTCQTGLADATANLLAPVVVNARTHAAAQVVLAGSDLPLRAPLQSSTAGI